jgi:hypothetical protein
MAGGAISSRCSKSYSNRNSKGYPGIIKKVNKLKFLFGPTDLRFIVRARQLSGAENKQSIVETQILTAGEIHNLFDLCIRSVNCVDLMQPGYVSGNADVSNFANMRFMLEKVWGCLRLANAGNEEMDVKIIEYVTRNDTDKTIASGICNPGDWGSLSSLSYWSEGYTYSGPSSGMPITIGTGSFGYNQNGPAGGFYTDPTDIGQMPFNSPLVGRYYRVTKVTKFCLGGGAEHEHYFKYKLNLMINNQYFQTTPDTATMLKGFSRGFIVIQNGQVVNVVADNGEHVPVLSHSSLNCCMDWHARLRPFKTMPKQEMTFANAVVRLTDSTSAEKFINDQTGASVSGVFS